jgi:hypothetical protein
MADAPYRVEELVCRSWASVTFTGTRHKVTLSVDSAAAARFRDGIEEAEFNLPGHILADIAVVSQAREGDEVRIALEALTVEDD